jgi:drug/metabolite transporter (DMT)-like permease
MHQSRPLYGLSLAIITAVLWGVLPLFLKICLQAMDASTITAYRFLVAGAFVFGLLLVRRKFPKPAQLTGRTGRLLAIACVMLVLNYVTNVMGLSYLNPESVQVIMQLAPFLLMFGGVVFLKESFNRRQQLGALVLVIGMALFFNQRWQTLSQSTTESPVGMLIIIFAATAWAIYALIQKPLLTSLSAQQITLFMYLGGFVLLVPLTDFAALWTLNALQFWALLFCCVNTIIAYGAFTEAMQVWSAGKVSAVLATAPIFTYISMYVGVAWRPDIFVLTALDELAYIGAALVVIGSIYTSLAKQSVVTAPKQS